MVKDDGGPAFPQTRISPGAHSVAYTDGMSLRDWFAGQALAGITADVDTNRSIPDVLAKWVYEIADAMVAERKK